MYRKIKQIFKRKTRKELKRTRKIAEKRTTVHVLTSSLLSE
jgi:hypothetical protein